MVKGESIRRWKARIHKIQDHFSAGILHEPYVSSGASSGNLGSACFHAESRQPLDKIGNRRCFAGIHGSAGYNDRERPGANTIDPF